MPILYEPTDRTMRLLRPKQRKSSSNPGLTAKLKLSRNPDLTTKLKLSPSPSLTSILIVFALGMLAGGALVYGPTREAMVAAVAKGARVPAERVKAWAEA